MGPCRGCEGPGRPLPLLGMNQVTASFLPSLGGSAERPPWARRGPGRGQHEVTPRQRWASAWHSLPSAPHPHQRASWDQNLFAELRWNRLVRECSEPGQPTSGSQRGTATCPRSHSMRVTPDTAVETASNYGFLAGGFWATFSHYHVGMIVHRFPLSQAGGGSWCQPVSGGRIGRAPPGSAPRDGPPYPPHSQVL